MQRQVTYQGIVRPHYVAPVDQYMKTNKQYHTVPDAEQTLYSFETNTHISRMLPLEQYRAPHQIDPKRDEIGTDGSPFYCQLCAPHSF